jgi:hypothetical protein
VAESITPYINDLFQYIDTYEKDYTAFKTEAFFQTYTGICAVFQTLRQERDRAVEIDRVFLEKIKKGPIKSSDLRQLTIQILISFFESIADTDGRSNRAYLHCREFRDVKRDVSYFQSTLMPILTRAGSLNNNFKLNQFFLKEMGRFILNYSSGWSGDISFEDFKALPDHQKLLELYLRRTKFGDSLFTDRNSLEFHMHSIGVFEKLKASIPLFKQYFEEWNYLVEDSFFKRLKARLGVLWESLKGIFSNYRYLRLALTQRYYAFVFYGIIIVIFILMAVLVPAGWNKFTDKKLTEFEKRIEATQNAIGR